MFTAIAIEPRLRTLSPPPGGTSHRLFVGDLIAEPGIPASTLSHHLDKLRNEDLVRVRREGTYLRYTANEAALQNLLTFLYAECCTHNNAVDPKKVLKACCR